MKTIHRLARIAPALPCTVLAAGLAAQVLGEAQFENESTSLYDADSPNRIEDGAIESELPLLLVGLFYAADLSLDRAVIETSQSQAQYAVGDELPVSGRVTVAKILPDRVILDNAGNYEFLHLFEGDSRLSSVASQERQAEETAAQARQATISARNRKIREMADAQRRGAAVPNATLANTINIETATDGGAHMGYRISPARDVARMEALGFREGDIIISINGVALSDPSQGPVLSRALRSGRNARYGILRDGEELSLTVGASGSLAQ